MRAAALEDSAERLRNCGMYESARGERVRAETMRSMVSDLQHAIATAPAEAGTPN